ncbi:nicotinate-nucleotide--dimethylbenzimidazole phosphoribosyltransferase [Vibrio sp. SM6]|uniref:Nicotinate-nucleotide--dimethylbenzimidazole phosphoribosyltransferase n=1 Tax=Vibrio agarilyticus TaxID=2726741 RepID=A0A7X8TQG9_9VIBR|nr:nicotinate-nucleotide--dimethylbenzimidazole phosphoribosyltransferase [Vibrio agarilyticus]NLS12936.1 nicotinate-nucleotide--dimethylbenzimidazole phosphoribosyltransferase [Vibrio agarilyticus]
MNFTTQWNEQIQQRIDNKTKPIGALGLLESTASQLANLASLREQTFVTQLHVDKPHLLLFAGDHGIAEQGVSIAPSAVTQQMVANFLHGGAAINGFCRVNGIDLTVIDCGILAPVAVPSNLNIITSSMMGSRPDSDKAPIQMSYLEQRLGTTTADFSQHAAMTQEQLEEGLRLGAEIAQTRLSQGANLLMFGEMGIANTSSAAALLAALTERSVAECVGRGTGINEQQLERKQKLIGQAVERVKALYGDTLTPKQALQELGGFEIVQMVGAFLAASQQRIPVLVDGFIVSVAALVATRMDTNARDVMIFAHQSHEAGHKWVLDALDAHGLLDLQLRLGEGTGAALAYPLVKASAEFYNAMASFESAGVTV